MVELNIREVKLEDIDKLIFLLDQLSPNKPEIDKIKVTKMLEYNLKSDNHFLVVLENKNEVIGTGQLIIQMNLSHNGSPSSHIENIVVDKNARQKGIGKKIVTFLIEKSKELKCYKVVLNCKKELIPFYQKCQLFDTGNIEMRYDFK
jgi:glucosamine-phosphate N-acetyltransferase